MEEKTNQLDSTCVVLAPSELADMASHVAQKHQLKPLVEHDPALAMASLCVLHLQHRSSQAWISSPSPLRLILVHTQKMHHIEQLVASVRKYLPNTIISELHEGRLEDTDSNRTIVDSLVDPPIIHSQPVDADELSMLLDDQTPEVEE